MENIAQFIEIFTDRLGHRLNKSQMTVLLYLINFGDCNLSQQELATSLKTSRMSVRDAIKDLVKLNIIDYKKGNSHNRGLISLKEEFKNVE